MWRIILMVLAFSFATTPAVAIKFKCLSKISQLCTEEKCSTFSIEGSRNYTYIDTNSNTIRQCIGGTNGCENFGVKIIETDGYIKLDFKDTFSTQMTVIKGEGKFVQTYQMYTMTITIRGECALNP